MTTTNKSDDKLKKFRLLITEGAGEDILAILVHECRPDAHGIINPPITIDFEGRNFILKRKWDKCPDAYVYTVTQTRHINDLLDKTLSQ